MDLPSLAILLVSVAALLTTAAVLVLLALMTLLGPWKGAPYVPSKPDRIDAMLELAAVGRGETIVDLGSGDGSILIEAAARGARGIGVEINPLLVWWSRYRIRRKRMEDRIRVVQKNFYHYPLAEADVITLYLWPTTLEKLEEKLRRELRPDARVVSHAFPIPGWSPTAMKDHVFLYQSKRARIGA